MALIETIYSYQADALRDALGKHLSFKTAIQVTLPRLNSFVLEFHLPFLTLRNTTTSLVGSIANDDDQASRTEYDVCFLSFQCAQHRGGKCVCKHMIRESQVSVVISGWDNHNWSAWGFFNTSSDPMDDFDPDEERIVNEDYFAADGNPGPVIDADSPIWDPRCYWLRIIDIRVRLVLKEWKWLVRNVEAGVTAWKKKHPVLRADISRDKHHVNIQELFDWTIEVMQLLRKLRERFERTIEAWARFCSLDGDQCYFSDLVDYGPRLSFEMLNRSFKGLEDLQQDLASLDRSCEESQAILKLCLDHENNRVSSESQELNRRAHSLNLQTNIISREIQGLNRKGTEAAVETVQAAQATSRATRSNVLVIWITTPLILALQYFGAEKDIFPFDRNAKTFVIALFILIFALPCLAYSLDYLVCVGMKFSVRLGIRPRKDIEVNRLDAHELQSQFSTVAAA